MLLCHGCEKRRYTKKNCPKLERSVSEKTVSRRNRDEGNQIESTTGSTAVVEPEVAKSVVKRLIADEKAPTISAPIMGENW